MNYHQSSFQMRRVSGSRFKLFCPPLTLTGINICTRSLYVDWSPEKTQCHIMRFQRMGWPGWHLHLGCFFNTVSCKGGGGLFYLRLRYIDTVCSVFLVQACFYKRLLLWPQGATLSNKRCQELFANLLSLLKIRTHETLLSALSFFYLWPTENEKSPALGTQGDFCFSRWLNSAMQVPTTTKPQTCRTKSAASGALGM